MDCKIPLILHLFAQCLFCGAGAKSTFEMLINPTGSATWVNYALSHDGKIMAANYGGLIYRWTPDTPRFPFGGFTFLGPGHFLNAQIGISNDGTTIITGRLGPDGNVNPATWNPSTLPSNRAVSLLACPCMRFDFARS
jgi:hypothetical protein